jgi:hypothetical protein
MSEMRIQFFSTPVLILIVSLIAGLGGLGLTALGMGLRQLKESTWITKGDFKFDFLPRVLEVRNQLQIQLAWLEKKIPQESVFLDYLRGSLVTELKLWRLFLLGNRRTLQLMSDRLLWARERAESRQDEILRMAHGDI